MGRVPEASRCCAGLVLARPVTSDLAVVDGVGWELQIAYRDRSTASRGSNAHPPKRQFELFLAAVRELTGGKPFE